jgi:hypothetical protein
MLVTSPFQFDPITQQASIESKNTTDSNERDLSVANPPLNRRCRHSHQRGQFRDIQRFRSLAQFFDNRQASHLFWIVWGRLPPINEEERSSEISRNVGHMRGPKD